MFPHIRNHAIRIHPLVVASLMIGGCSVDEPTVEIVQRHFALPPPPAKLAKVGVGIPNPFGVITKVDGQRLVRRGEPAYQMVVMLIFPTRAPDALGGMKQHCIMVWLVRPAADWVVDSVSWSPICRLND
jgi:hypothetical protein